MNVIFFSGGFPNRIQLYTLNSAELLWTRDRPIAETSTSQNTIPRDRHQCPDGFRTRNPSKQAKIILSHYRLDKPLGLHEVEALRISRHSTHEDGKVFSPTHRSPFPPPGRHPCHSFVLETEGVRKYNTTKYYQSKL